MDRGELLYREILSALTPEELAQKMKTEIENGGSFTE